MSLGQSHEKIRVYLEKSILCEAELLLGTYTFFMSTFWCKVSQQLHTNNVHQKPGCKCQFWYWLEIIFPLYIDHAYLVTFNYCNLLWCTNVAFFQCCVEQLWQTSALVVMHKSWQAMHLILGTSTTRVATSLAIFSLKVQSTVVTSE